MTSYFPTIKEAFNHRNASIPIQHIGRGSLFSWKVEVLVHDAKNGWAFENANLFQRIIWKISKYVPFLKASYQRVNLDRIYHELKKQNEVSPALMARIETLWQKRSGQTAKATPAQKTPLPTDFLQRYPWLKDVPREYVDCPQFNLTRSQDTDIIIDLQGHGEVIAVGEFLKLNKKDCDKLVGLIYKPSPNEWGSVNVLYFNGDKVRLYICPDANTNPSLFYKEYDSFDKAIDDFKKDCTNKEFSEFHTLRSIHQDLYAKWRCFSRVESEKNCSVPYIKEFYKQYNEKMKDIDIVDAEVFVHKFLVQFLIKHGMIREELPQPKK